MKFQINPTTGKYFFELEESDLQDAQAIKFFTERLPCPHCGGKLPNAWEIVSKYWQAGQDAILVEGMDGIRTRGKRDLSDMKWAVLKGFTECIAIPRRIVERADQYLNLKAKNQAEEYDSGIQIEP